MDAYDQIITETERILQGAHSPKACRAAMALRIMADAAFAECDKFNFPDKDRPLLCNALRCAAKEMTE